MEPLDPAGSYRVVANSFLIGGGDSFAAFTNGTDPVTGPLDVDTSVAYLAANSPLTPPAAVKVPEPEYEASLLVVTVEEPLPVGYVQSLLPAPRSSVHSPVSIDVRMPDA